MSIILQKCSDHVFAYGIAYCANGQHAMYDKHRDIINAALRFISLCEAAVNQSHTYSYLHVIYWTFNRLYIVERLVLKLVLSCFFKSSRPTFKYH